MALRLYKIGPIIYCRICINTRDILLPCFSLNPKCTCIFMVVVRLLNAFFLSTENAALFAQLVARTAKDIDVLIDSLPNEDSSPELQVHVHHPCHCINSNFTPFHSFLGRVHPFISNQPALSEAHSGHILF